MAVLFNEVENKGRKLELPCISALDAGIETAGNSKHVIVRADIIIQ